LVENRKTSSSDLAVIGIYYFKEVGDLKQELQNVLDNNIKMVESTKLMMGLNDGKGKVFKTGHVDEWMDCNKAVTVETNSRMLGFLEEEAALVAVNVRIDNSTIIPPCYIGRCVFNQFHCRAKCFFRKGCHVTG
jgi:glucose-1-phosphate thymidylyltransferase